MTVHTYFCKSMLHVSDKHLSKTITPNLSYVFAAIYIFL
nr:MAG TPA_asm: hypothetical protein [Bacteriophage sp.]